MISSVIFLLIGLGTAILLVTAALSPIETLSWWAGWTEREIEEDPGAPETEMETETATAPAAKTEKPYIVYLSGIASLSGRYLAPREKAFIKALRARLPEAVVIADVFPYSPDGLPLLASPRVFDRLWRRIQRLRIEGRRDLLSTLINMRNVFQVMVSADHRYGPIFNQGAANVIEAALLRAGYVRGSGAPVTIIGYSGGGQVAIGAAGFLTAGLAAPVDVIAVGGVVASDPGLHFVRRTDYIYGDRDNIQKIGAVMFPERWGLMAHSEWNQARRDRRIVFHKMADMMHAGPRGYFGRPKRNGLSNSERTLERIVSIVKRYGAADAASRSTTLSRASGSGLSER